MLHKFNLVVAVVLFACTLFLNSCKSYDVASRYTSKYIKSNIGKVSAEVPEVFELGYTMLALTDLAQKDSGVINRNTPYYQELMAWFNKYKNHKGVMRLNADLSRNPDRIKNYLDGLYALQVKYNRVSLKTSYRIDLNKVDFKGYALLLQNFYKKTNFHEFYTQHEGYYNDMVQNANSLFTFAEVQKNLNGTVKGYRVILSPLTKAYAGTMQISGRGYSECIIFPALSSKGTNYIMADMIALNKVTE